MPGISRKDVTLDARPDRLDLRDRVYQPPLKDLPTVFPPRDIAFKVFRHYAEECSLVLKQGDDGACTGFGLAAVINYLRWKETFLKSTSSGDIDVEADDPKTCISTVSERMLYQNARIYDEWDGEDYEGSSCRGAMKGWHRHGVCDSSFWKYRDNNDRVRFVPPKRGWDRNAIETPLGSYYRINKASIADMQAAIVEVGAIYCSCYAHSGWFDLSQVEAAGLEDYSDLPVIGDSKQSDNFGGHAFAIVGYMRDGFILQNSWGTNWGLSGFAVLKYADWIDRGMDAWVVVRGAPTTRTSSPTTVVHRALQEKTAKPDDREGLIIQSMSEEYFYAKDAVKPWGEEQAYKHTIVIGSNGRAVQKIIDVATPEDCIDKIARELPKDWMAHTGNKKIVVYVLGGLSSEKTGIRRAQILGPYFYANGIYPIFISWKSGVASNLNSLIDECWKEIVTDPESGNIMPNISADMNEKIDRALEVALKRKGGKSLWTEMKITAFNCCETRIPAASGNGAKVKGAMVNLADSLGRLGKIELHLVAHSAGSVLLGNWLDVLARRKSMKVKTISLYAPACTVRFANEHLNNAVAKALFSKTALSVDVLSSEREKADTIGPYNKSLLYLVSRAFEDMHKEPIFGLHASWVDKDGQNEYSDQNVKPSDEQIARMESIDAMRDFWKKHLPLNVLTKQNNPVSTSRKNDSIPLSHTSFENDIEIMEATLKRITGASKLKCKVENLAGF